MIKIWIKLFIFIKKVSQLFEKISQLSRKLSLNNNFISLIMIWLIFSSTTMVVVIIEIIEIIDSDTTLMIWLCVVIDDDDYYRPTNQPINRHDANLFSNQINQNSIKWQTNKTTFINKNRSKTRLASCILSLSFSLIGYPG